MSKEPIIIPPDHETREAVAESAPEEKSIIVAQDVLPETLPIIPLRDRPMFPKMMAPLIIDDTKMQKILLDESPDSSPLYLGLLMVRPAREGSDDVTLDPDNFYTVGVAVKALKIIPPSPDIPMQILVQVLERFNVVSIHRKGSIFQARVNYWFEAAFDTNEELKAYSLAIVDSIKELVQLNPLFKEGLSLLMEKINVNDPGALADFSASMTTADGAELQKILEIRSIRNRIEKVLILLKREIEISKLKVQITKRIEERISKQQRNFFLKEQLKEIKKELGLSKDDRESEIEKFQKRIRKLTLSSEARNRIDEEMEKLKLLEPSSPEFNVTRAYLDWLTILPWGVYTKDNYDIKHAAKVLDREHFGLQDVKDRILELISVGIVKGDLAGSIILLVGPPGTGKTSIGQSIAKSLGRKFYRFSLGGMRDEAEIKGHRRTYIGALPGKFIQAMKTCNTSNPLIMLDEIDKIGASFRGDPASALLEVLDPEQNKDFLDHYLDVRFDLSKVLFICTANQLETIPPPLIDRTEIIRLSGYILEEKVEIARRHLIPRQMKRHGLTTGNIFFPKAVLRVMIDGYSREAGVRILENNIKKVLRKAARRIVEKDITRWKIKKEELVNLLGKRVFSEDKAFTKGKVGVVTGLAYTTLGGATLFVEATPVPSESPGYKQTGQLGKVMVESSEIAYTYIRSLLRDDKSARTFFNNHLIHLHVPAGATPKDGPSAGITMACAIYSLVINQPILNGIAMTGELTLSGLIMPIGGLKEKLIAAKRTHITSVLIPRDNQEDFERLDEKIKKGLTPCFVGHFKEVIKAGFPSFTASKNKGKP